jgi:hypothetical protein
MSATDTHRSIDAVWRIESPRLIAGLTRMTRDVGFAEDLAQEDSSGAVARLRCARESRGVADDDGEASCAGSVSAADNAGTQT